MRLVLLRHGNTFAPGEKVVMVGAHEDLPLVPSGIEQAERCAAALRPHLTRVLCAPLLRTRQYAQHLAEAPEIDARLRELDYGRWAGLSDDEVRARGDGAALEAWRKAGDWPAGIFAEEESAVLTRIRAFVAELDAGTVGVVTSQGILRCFLRVLAPEHRPTAKIGIGTGHGALFVDGRLVAWNVSPNELASHL